MILSSDFFVFWYHWTDPWWEKPFNELLTCTATPFRSWSQWLTQIKLGKKQHHKYKHVVYVFTTLLTSPVVSRYVLISMCKTNIHIQIHIYKHTYHIYLHSLPTPTQFCIHPFAPLTQSGISNPKIEALGPNLAKSSSLFHGNLRGPPQCHPPKQIRP